MSLRNDYLRWSKSQDKIYFKQDKTGRITRVVKRLDQSLLPIYQKLSRVRSPYLPQILSIGEPKDGIIEVEEQYVEGESLQERMDTQKTHSYSEALQCFLDIAQALKTLHSLEPPVIHRDIKPSNIIKSKAGMYVLVDFDASRLFDTGQDKDTRIVLPPGYAAPEQYGLCQSDGRSDIFSLGVTIYEMYSGRPFHPDEPRLKGALGRIITKCTAISPRKRYQSAQKLICALQYTQLEKKYRTVWLAIGLLGLLWAGCALYGWKTAAIPCTCTLDVTQFTTNMDGLQMQEGDAPIELELAITPQIDRSLCRAKHHAENVEITLINVARSNPEGIGIGIDHVNRLTFYRPGRIWLSAYIRFNHREYYIDTFEQMIGSPRCTCVADMERVRLYPRYIVLENDQPIQTQITLDYSDAIRRENCPAEEHAPDPTEYLECFLDGGAQQRRTAYLTQQGVLTAYKPDCFKISMRAMYNGNIGGRGEVFYTLSEDMADTFIPMIEDSCRDGCTCGLDADKIALSCMEMDTGDGGRQLQIMMDASNAYRREGCTADEHSVLGDRLISHFIIRENNEQMEYTENGRILNASASVVPVSFLTSFNGAFYEIEQSLELTVESAKG
ncbi:MAG: serine/threonine protein kinase [Christensenellaceae bacterium]|nr:serine/threonine protein kinase [Christensenellaceae bacterium]